MMSKPNLFEHRHLAIATMHGKEKIIGPLMEEALSVKCFLPQLNTNILGTFTGEITRNQSPLNAARLKCKMALEKSGLDLAIASEGSFGPHPLYGFIQANEEIVLLYDQKNKLEFLGKNITTETNFCGRVIESYQEGIHFANEIGFPEHGIIIRKTQHSKEIYHKGITDEKLLQSSLINLLTTHKTVWLETDMRAMYNPTRQISIKNATLQLLEKLDSHCPKCNFPGYWIQNGKDGLPCACCGSPTASTLYHEMGCVNCSHTERKMYPNKKTKEDPMFCNFCNP